MYVCTCVAMYISVGLQSRALTQSVPTVCILSTFGSQLSFCVVPRLASSSWVHTNMENLGTSLAVFREHVFYVTDRGVVSLLWE